MRYNELVRAGISLRTLRRFLVSGDVLRLRPGYYEWVSENGPDEYALLRRIFPDAVLCMQSALYILGYTDRVPNAWHLAVPLNATRSKLNRPYPNIKAYFRTQQSLHLGVTYSSVGSCSIAHYDRERTVCDCIVRRNRMDRELYVKAIRAFFNDPTRNISLLLSYARLLRIEKITRQITELCQ